MFKTKKKYLALILARRGSKRLKNKNILKLGKKRLISITLENLIKVKYLFNDILISSDSKIVEKITKQKKLIFVKRPKYLAHGNVSSEAATIHAIKFYNKKFGPVDYVVLFQVTSPFRKNSTVKKAIKLSKKYSNKQVVGVNKKNLKPNGVIYITPIKLLQKLNSFSHKNFVPLIIGSKKESLDIDYKKDFLQAEKFLNKI